MRLRRCALVTFGVAAAALVAVLPVGAKEGVKATLVTSVPLDAAAGTQLEVAWTLFSVDEQGKRRPFGANGVFVRLLSASGDDAEEGVAPVGAYRTGEYEATVVVPDGGIGDVEIGLQGWVSGPTGTRRSDLLFPITNDPVPGTASQPASVRPDAGSTTWIFLVLAGALSTLAVLAAGLALHRKHRRAATPATDRAEEEISPLFPHRAG